MTAKPLIDRLVVVGLGLIGGSLALQLKQAGAVKKVVGVARTEHTRRILQSIPCTPKEAVAAGFLDQLVDREKLLATAIATATELSKLPSKFYASNKLDLRAPSLERMRNALKVDSYGLE